MTYGSDKDRRRAALEREAKVVARKMRSGRYVDHRSIVKMRHIRASKEYMQQCVDGDQSVLLEE